MEKEEIGKELFKLTERLYADDHIEYKALADIKDFARDYLLNQKKEKCKCGKDKVGYYCCMRTDCDQPIKFPPKKEPSLDHLLELAKEEGERRFKLTKDFPMHPANLKNGARQQGWNECSEWFTQQLKNGKD